MIDYSENLKKGDLESLKLVSRLLTGTAVIVDQCGYEKISKDKLVLFWLKCQILLLIMLIYWMHVKMSLNWNYINTNKKYI